MFLHCVCARPRVCVAQMSDGEPGPEPDLTNGGRMSSDAFPTPSSLGFVVPTKDEIREAIALIVTREYDGQCVRFVREPEGNVGRALREVCGRLKVIIPGPIEFTEVVKEAAGREWAMFTRLEAGQINLTLFAPDKNRLPTQLN